MAPRPDLTRRRHLGVWALAALRYVRRHWQGRLPLAVSFWVNFVALAVVLHVVGGRVLGAVPGDPGAVFLVALAWFIVFHVLVYAWQVCGVWRASERAMLDHAPYLRVRSAQVIVVLSIVAVLSEGLEVVHLGYARHVALSQPPRPVANGYRLELAPDASVVRLRGAIDFGLTGELAELLRRHPSIHTIDLQSDGGKVAEGRGIAKLIDQYELATYAPHDCLSACALAFLNGTSRHIGPQARLGFHSYRLNSPHVTIFMDPDDELDRDLGILEGRRIAPEFLERVAETPHNEMWFPSHEELIHAGAVHGIRPQLR